MRTIILSVLLLSSLSLNVYWYGQLLEHNIDNSIATPANQSPNIIEAPNVKTATDTQQHKNDHSSQLLSGQVPPSVVLNQSSNNDPTTLSQLDQQLHLTTKPLQGFSSQIDNLVKQANDAFIALEFYPAFELLLEIDNQHALAAQQLRQQWISQFAFWLQQDQVNTILGGLTVALEYEPDEHRYSSLLAKTHITLGLYDKAVNIYYDLMQTSNEQNQAILWQKQARETALKELQKMHDNLAWSEMLEWLQYLLSQDPNYSEYLILNAQAHIELGHYDEAEYILQDLSYYPELAQQVEYLQKLLNVALSDAINVPLTPYNKHYLAQSYINDIPITLMLDTGASLTVVNKPTFEDLALASEMEFIEQVNMNTAGGIATAYIYLAKSFTLGSVTVNNLEIAVMDMPVNQKSDGLLGMNFLEQFQFYIDQNKNKLLLEPIIKPNNKE